MTGERIAVIDLGSNTFHLMICEINEDRSWNLIHKEREYVKLASGGMDVINEDSQQRAIDAMIRFSNLIRTHEVTRTRAIGTAVLREAENGKALTDKLLEITGITIEIIDGQMEARYILMGIQSVLPPLDRYGLIMDIGGGSVEFILYKDQKVDFKSSFKIGVAVLYRMFHKSDPIAQHEIEALEAYVGNILEPLREQLEQLNQYYLIGASGSFEVMYDMLPKKQTSMHWAELEMEGLPEYIEKVIHAPLAERRLMPEIPPERVDYIVVAYLLIRFILRTTPPEKLYFCEFALKEGVIAEMIDG